MLLQTTISSMFRQLLFHVHVWTFPKSIYCSALAVHKADCQPLLDKILPFSEYLLTSCKLPKHFCPCTSTKVACREPQRCLRNKSTCNPRITQLTTFIVIFRAPAQVACNFWQFPDHKDVIPPQMLRHHSAVASNYGRKYSH